MMQKSLAILSVLLFSISFSAHSETLRPGPWRFELKTANGIVPFIIVIKKEKDHFSGTLKNGNESIELKMINTNNKNVEIPLQTYEMSLEMEQAKEGRMTGYLIRHNKNPKIKTPVFAVHGIDERFPKGKSAPSIDINGRWAITLTEEDGTNSSGILILNQKKHELTGSILTPTGDYRYMEGFVSGTEFEMASFDGVYNYLIKGNLNKDVLTARILAGYITKIVGKKDPTAELPDAYKQTQIEKLNFKFPNLKGKEISLRDKRFKNKPLVIQIFGSWCPNCIDEMNFLIPWYIKNKSRGVEIVGIAFERSLDHAEAKKQLRKFQKQKNVPYPLLIAGYTAEDKPMEKIPGLTNFISYPTTVFLNRKHEVVKVHAGFSGPSTGEFYEKFILEFNQTVDGLLK